MDRYASYETPVSDQLVSEWVKCEPYTTKVPQFLLCALGDQWGRAILGGGCLFGIGSLCFYGLGLSGEEGAIDRAG